MLNVNYVRKAKCMYEVQLEQGILEYINWFGQVEVLKNVDKN
jgi:hypothetical protein